MTAPTGEEGRLREALFGLVEAVESSAHNDPRESRVSGLSVGEQEALEVARAALQGEAQAVAGAQPISEVHSLEACEISPRADKERRWPDGEVGEREIYVCQECGEIETHGRELNMRSLGPGEKAERADRQSEARSERGSR